MSDTRRAMEDVLPSRTIVKVAAGVLVAILVGAAISTTLVLARPADAPGGGQAPSAIGMVEQTSIVESERGLAVARRDRAALESYAWIDADAGVAQVPIAAAMARTVAAYADGGTR